MYGMTNTTEAYTLNTYYDLTKKSILVKPRFNFKYILRKYPYRLNNYNGVIKTNLYYLNLLPKGIKIIKKYIFLQNLKRKYFLKFHNNFYEENKLYSNIILKKLRN
jgi:hypothetical protein